MNNLTEYFNEHPVSISIAIAGAYLFIAVLGFSWPFAIFAGVVGFILGQKIDED